MNNEILLLKTRREEGHQFVNVLPDRHAQFVIIQWITCVVPKLGKSPHAFAMCSIRTDLLKQENEKIDSL